MEGEISVEESADSILWGDTCEDFADGLHCGGNFMCVQVGLELVFKSS